MPEVTFRDFAGAVMTNDLPAAGRVLEALLGLEAGPAHGAAEYFQAQMAAQGQAFMMKAMGLRTAVTSGSDEQTRPLLIDCFGLAGDDLDGALAALRQRYAP
ncbi:MAG TPA: hypothetical protein VK698_19180 [Kofleriaceae bacterium]|nr:hypothetical protein [Kofleriaceae bacterium]